MAEKQEKPRVFQCDHDPLTMDDVPWALPPLPDDVEPPSPASLPPVRATLLSCIWSIGRLRAALRAERELLLLALAQLGTQIAELDRLRAQYHQLRESCRERKAAE